MHLLTADTVINLKRLDWTPYVGMVLDKHSKYRPGDRAIWKTGVYEKTVHGWKKVAEKDNTASLGIKLNKNNLEKNRTKLKKVIISKAQPGVIKGTLPAELRKSAKAWIKANIKEPVKTEIGNVTFKETSADAIFNHGNHKEFREKADVIPCIKDILSKGVYLGEAPDFEGKPITNHYFAGKVNTPTGKKIVFCRVRDSNGDPERPRFYFHDIMTMEDVIKQGALPKRGTNKSQKPSGSPLFRSLVYNYLFVK